MSKETKIEKLFNRLLDFAEGRIFQTIALTIISLISIHLFMLMYNQLGSGYWFLVLLALAIFNIVLINSGSRKHIKVGVYLSLLLIIASLLTALYALVVYLILYSI